MFSQKEMLEILQARPFEDLPQDAQVFQQAQWGMEIEEIAIYHQMQVDELTSKFGLQIIQGRVKGMMDLRREQHYAAIGDRKAAMLKHLGQHRLSQIDELLVRTSPLDGIEKTMDVKSMTKEQLLDLAKKFIDSNTKTDGNNQPT